MFPNSMSQEYRNPSLGLNNGNFNIPSNRFAPNRFDSSFQSSRANFGSSGPPPAFRAASPPKMAMSNRRTPPAGFGPPRFSVGESAAARLFANRGHNSRLEESYLSRTKLPEPGSSVYRRRSPVMPRGVRGSSLDSVMDFPGVSGQSSRPEFGGGYDRFKDTPLRGGFPDFRGIQGSGRDMGFRGGSSERRPMMNGYMPAPVSRGRPEERRPVNDIPTFAESRAARGPAQQYMERRSLEAPPQFDTSRSAFPARPEERPAIQPMLDDRLNRAFPMERRLDPPLRFEMPSAKPLSRTALEMARDLGGWNPLRLEESQMNQINSRYGDLGPTADHFETPAIPHRRASPDFRSSNRAFERKDFGGQSFPNSMGKPRRSSPPRRQSGRKSPPRRAASSRRSPPRRRRNSSTSREGKGMSNRPKSPEPTTPISINQGKMGPPHGGKRSYPRDAPGTPDKCKLNPMLFDNNGGGKKLTRAAARNARRARVSALKRLGPKLTVSDRLGPKQAKLGHETKEGKEGKNSGAKASEPKDEDITFVKEVPIANLMCKLCKTTHETNKQYLDHVVGADHNEEVKQLKNRLQILLTSMRKTQRERQKKNDEIVKQSEESGGEKKLSVYCQTCKMFLSQKKSEHNKCELHLLIAEFLMPKCSACNDAHFTSPMAFERHAATLEHIQAVAPSNGEKDSGLHFIDMIAKKFKDIAGITSPEDEEDLVTLDEIGEVEGEVKATGEAANIKDNEAKKGESGKSKLTEKVPVVDPTVVMAKEFVKRVQMYFCELCHKFLPRPDVKGSNVQDLIDLHCKTESHQKYFIKAEAEKQSKNGRSDLDEAAEIERAEKKLLCDDDNMLDFEAESVDGDS
eukprot:maker-scaffold14_size734282-snap-gene-1.25 protein:Tk11281 transcript:maker-scaffold14_size734282-snap-gene-1.25-mRNA-1 annotation:"hypothetical protein AaeL_AAEL005277"